MSADPTAPATSVRRPSLLDSAGSARSALIPAARGESLAAFDGRCILAGCVAPPSNTPGILGRHALPARRLSRLGATPRFPHGLLGSRGLRASRHISGPVAVFMLLAVQ